MKKEITIVVAGKVGAGKTTIMQIIEDALVAKGIIVRTFDDERQNRQTFTQRTKAVAENNTEVTIKTVRTARDLTVTEPSKLS